MHGHEGRAEDQQQDRHLVHARGVQGRPQDQGRVPRPRRVHRSGGALTTLPPLLMMTYFTKCYDD